MVRCVCMAVVCIGLSLIIACACITMGAPAEPALRIGFSVGFLAALLVAGLGVTGPCGRKP